MEDDEDGEMIECPSCQGWDASETGMHCLLCDGDGVIWNVTPATREPADG